MVQKWPFRDAQLLFKKRPWNHYFYSVFVCALFGPSCQKRENLDTQPKKKKIFTDNWKAHFEYFLFFLVFLVFFFFLGVLLFFLLCFFWGFKGHVRWPEGPPHLALNPPYLFFCFCFVFVLFCFFAFFFGGFKGQVRWPEGPPHLALNPPYLVFCLFTFLFSFFCSFPFFVFNRKKTCFPPKKGIFLFIFSVSLSFSLNLFWPPPFSLSLSLSLCFALVFLSSFLSFFFVFLFWLSFSFLFLSLFFVLSSVLLFLEKNNMKILNWNFFCSSKCSLFWVSCLVFSLKSLFLIFVFSLILSYVFCSTSLFLVSKNQVEKHQFWVKRRVAT